MIEYAGLRGTSLVVQWLRLCAASAGGTGSVTGWGTKIPHATWHNEKNFFKDGVRACKVPTAGPGESLSREERRHPLF